MTKANLLRQREREQALEELRRAWLVLHFNHNRRDCAVWYDIGCLQAIVGRALEALDGGVYPAVPSSEALRPAEEEADRPYVPMQERAS
jgi:hypothetical protein